MATRIQLRRDIETNWTLNDPILAAGEVAISTDLEKIKIGDGTSSWSELSYINLTPTEIQSEINSAVSALVDNSPELLDTLNELAAAINDDPDFFNTIATNLSNHESDTTNIHGITDTSDLVYTDDPRLIDERPPGLHASTHGVGATDEVEIAPSQVTNLVNDLSLITSSIDDHIDSFTDVHGIADTSLLATISYVDNVVSGLDWHPAANLLSNSNISLNGTSGTLVIDGHSALDSGDDQIYRILLINQSTSSQNGIYTYTDNGSTYTLVRSTDADTYQELIGASIFVVEGTTYGATSWVQRNHYLSSFSDQEWTQFSGSGTYIAGEGILLDGNEFSNTGVLSVTGTSNQISVLPIGESTGDLNLSLPSTINVNTSGNSATSTSLATARNFTIGSTAKSFNGTANVSWSLLEIGAQPADADLTSISGLTATSGILKKTAANTWILADDYLTGNQLITLTGDATGSGTTSISVTVADDSHNHIISNVDGLQSALDGKVDDSQVLTNVPLGAVFTDTVTNQTITLGGDVVGTGTDTIIVSINDDSHNHIISNVDGLQTALNAKAPLSSPNLTGIPTAPTADIAENTTQIATTAFVNLSTAALVDSAPTTLNTLNKIAFAINDDPDFFNTIATNLSNHESDTTNIHGITDTSDLVYTDDPRLIDERPPGLHASTHGVGATDEVEIAPSQVTGTAVITTDSRLSNQRVPTDNSVTSAKIVNGAIVDADINASAAIAPSKISGTAVITTDSRLSDSRTPTSHAASHSSGQSDALTLSQSQITGLETSLLSKAPVASPTFTGTVTLASDPTSALHATTKQYVDNIASGIVAKPSVLGATTENLNAIYSNGTLGVNATLTSNSNGVFPSNTGGATGWELGSGILVKDQTNKAQNGRYYISNMGTVSTPYVLTRCGYCDEADEIPGAYIFVQSGTNEATGWILIVDDPTTFVVGTNDINVYQFTGEGTYSAGTGISINANVISLASHNHAISDVTGLQTALDGKAATNQTLYIGTTALAINRSSATQSLTGITSIDGSASSLTTARTLNIGSTGKTFNGTANVSWSITEIGAQPLDADLTAIAALSGTSGFLKKTSADTWSLDTNSYLSSNQTITLSGDATGSGTTSISVTVADDSHNHIIANVDGLQAALDGKVDDSQVLTNVPLGAVFTDTVTNQTITLSGDATGSGTTAITVVVVDDSHSHSNSTISSLDAGKITTGTLAVARGGTGVTTSTGTGSVVLSASPTFTGTVTAATLDLTTAVTTTAASHYWVATGSDGVVRPKTLANVQTEVVSNTAMQSNIVSPTSAGSNGIRKTTMSTSEPTGGADGDVWLVYA